MSEWADVGISDLSRICGRHPSRAVDDVHAAGHCYELFRRAVVERDEAAWRTVISDYRRLVLYWLGPHADEDTLQEVFLRFWQSQRHRGTSFTTRFPNIGAVMGYLKQCAVTVRIEAERAQERERRLRERVRQAAVLETVVVIEEDEYHRDDRPDIREAILSHVQSEEERVVFEETYRRGLTPREIQARRPDLFPTREAVYRVKENLLKRLRRDEELRKLWRNS